MKRNLSPSAIGLQISLALAAAFLPCTARADNSAVTNVGFETGDFTGWSVNTTGHNPNDTQIVSNYDEVNNGAGHDWFVYPAGNHAARLQPKGSTSASNMYADLGLGSAAQTTFQTNYPNPTNFTYVYQTVHLNSGDTVSMAWSYVATDYSPYNDASVATFVDTGDATAQGQIAVGAYSAAASQLAILGSTCTHGNYVTGDYGSTGWQTITFTATATGDWKIGFVVFNLSDTVNSPVLYVDDSQGLTFQGGIQGVGTPFGPIPANGDVSPPPSQTTPTITTPPTASAITYGQTLASSTLSGGSASVAGTFAFTTSSTTPGTGTASQGVTFTPTDTTDYTTATTSVSVTVNKAATSISTAPTASAITYGQTLASSTLSGGSGSVAGTFAFTTPSTAPGAGTASYSVTFTPTDTTNYATSTTTISVTVNKASSSITTPPTASAITYGQTLASSTLSGGSGSVAGTFAFTTPSTAPGAGTASYSVTFTPTDTTDYAAATTTVNVTVNKGAPSITWNPAAMTYGTVLSGAQLNATATAAGTFYYNPSLGAALSAGSHLLSVTFTPSDTADYTAINASVTLVVNSASATVTLGGLAQVYDGTPKSVTATTVPSGLIMSTVYGGSTGAPTNAGTYAVTATVVDPNYIGIGSGALIISLASQTISFPTAGAVIGGPIALNATASSGLPVAFALVSGNATISGSTLTINDGNPVTVRASQAGSANYNAAPSVTQTITAQPSKQPQTITFAQPADQQTNSAPFNLSATASSGLPVTFTILSGPAMLNGSAVTLTGVSGTVSVQASQAGNSVYGAAPSVTTSFRVVAVGTQTFFGTTGGTNGSDFGDGQQPEATTGGGTNLAAYIAPDNSGGTIIGYLSAQSEGFVVNFTTNSAGGFTASTTALTSTGAAGPTLTFVGQVAGGLISGTINPLGVSFSAKIDPLVGPTASIAGYYQGASLDSSAGMTYSVVGSQGDAYILSITPTLVVSGSGGVDSTNSFSVSTTQSVTVTGAINPATTTITGTVTTPTGAAACYSGIATTTTRTDRLINLSSRSFVGTGQSVLVAGFVLGGPNPKSLLLRAAGPALAPFGVPGVLAKPVLTLFDGNGNVLLTNSGWNNDPGVAAAVNQVGAFPFAAGSADAAVVTTLQPGAYTMQVSGANGGTGIALAEIYDASINPQSQYQRLVNISSRGFVTSGAGALINGFIVTGNSPKMVLIRGVGPTLQSSYNFPNALADPILNVYDSTGALVAQNDNWGTPVTVSSVQVAASASTIASAASSVGAFPLTPGSNDSALVVTLAPGAYTAQVSGANGTSGVALLEVYEIPQ